MGKKKKSFYKKSLMPFFADNRVLLAAIGGVAAGISIAGILGTEKAQRIVSTIEDTAKDYVDKVKQGFNEDDDLEEAVKPRRRTNPVGTA